MPLIATNTPGVFVIPELGKEITLTDWEEKDIYDTVAIAGGTTLAGEEFSFHTDVEQKPNVDSNQKTGSKMPARHELIVLKPGFFVRPIWGVTAPEAADQAAIYASGVYELLKNDKPQVTATHLWRMASGYGLVAYGLDLAAAVTPMAPTSLGVASPAAIPPLLVPFVIQPEDDFSVELAFEKSRAGTENSAGIAPVFTPYTTAQDVAMSSFLHGFVKSPATRG